MTRRTLETYLHDSLQHPTLALRIATSHAAYPVLKAAMFVSYLLF